MTETDVVIIGAGMGGLTTAAYLARAGLTVRVFEQHTLPGGYISSFIRDGFTFPAGPTCFGSNGIIFPILKELGLEGKRHFARTSYQMSWGPHDVPFLTPQQTCRDLAIHFPGEASNLQRYFRWVRIGIDGFRAMLESGLMFGENVATTTIRLGLRHPLFLWAMAIARRQTNRSLHERYFKDALLRQMLNQLGYPVMAGQNTLGMWGAYFDDTWVPVGGMQGLANALMRFVHEHGGQVHLGKRVSRIRVEDRAAVGVDLADGTFVPARVVVTAADLYHTFFDLIGREHLLPILTNKLDAAVPSESIFAVFLGLRDSPRLETELQRFQGSHIWFTCANGEYIQLVLLSKDDPSIAPPGKHALFIGRLSPYEEWETLKSDNEAYQARKLTVTRRLIEQAGEFLPGLSEHIEVQEAASPLTYERYTSNWRAGSAGWNWDPQRSTHIDFSKDVTLGNFFAVGHYVHSPGGVPTAMITAWYIAREILKRK
ncbi:MAG: NAD(P)/FAD-dependent oxidoreductase [Anaerolineae bacterium]|nr:NAD(P)/FAD-dependent oxidoreductase [Anaerolineae bacterium]